MQINFIEMAQKRYGEFFSGLASDFRKLALIIDEDPTQIKNYLDLPAITFLTSDQSSTCLERTQYLEALAYGDPGVLLACPGPSLSGLMLRELGTSEQKDIFFSIIQEKKLKTFFALTEVNKGSDANNITTRLIKRNNKLFLEGEKCFFGNAAVADTGVVLARVNEGPVGIRAIWLKPEVMQSDRIERCSLDMAALRGAQIGYMKFSELEVDADCILGYQKSACENGLLSIIKVFNRLRTGVGGLAIGHAQGVLDLVVAIRSNLCGSEKRLLSTLTSKIATAREGLHYAAKCVDKNESHQFEVAASKILATRIAEEVMQSCLNLCDVAHLIEYPWILKSYRDVFCWEFMEGTSAIQKKQMKSALKGGNHVLPLSYTA